MSSGLLTQTRRFAIDNPHLCKFWDQDALNKVFEEGLWTPLNVRWNYGDELAADLPHEYAFIKHFSYKYKPWGPKKQPFWLADAFW